MSDERALLSRRPSATNTQRHPVERGNRARYRARPTAPSAEALDEVGDSNQGRNRRKDHGAIRVGARLQSGRLDLAACSEPAARRGASGLRAEPRRLRRAQKPDASGFTAETQADEVAQLMFYEDLKDVILVGTSYGGMVACRTAELMRERISRLVFVDALTLFDGEKVADIL